MSINPTPFGNPGGVQAQPQYSNGSSNNTDPGYIFKDEKLSQADRDAFMTIYNTKENSDGQDVQAALKTLSQSKDSISQEFSKVVGQGTYNANTMHDLLYSLDNDTNINKETADQALLFAQQRTHDDSAISQTDQQQLQSEVDTLNPTAAPSALSKNGGFLLNNPSISAEDKQNLQDLSNSTGSASEESDILKKLLHSTNANVADFAQTMMSGNLSNGVMKDTLWALDHDANLDKQSSDQNMIFAAEQVGNDSHLSQQDRQQDILSTFHS